MGRRKKEPEVYHREQIANAAKEFFARQGIEQTTMDDIAKAAGYSKAAFYVHYRNKEELVEKLQLQGLRILLEQVRRVLKENDSIKARYHRLCWEMVSFHDRSPFLFDVVLKEIHVDFENSRFRPVEREIGEVGNELNAEIAHLLEEGIRAGELRGGLSPLPTVMLYWASLSGVIQLAGNQAVYLQQGLGLTRQEFLTHSLQTPLFRDRKRDLPGTLSSPEGLADKGAEDTGSKPLHSQAPTPVGIGRCPNAVDPQRRNSKKMSRGKSHGALPGNILGGKEDERIPIQAQTVGIRHRSRPAPVRGRILISLPG